MSKQRFGDRGLTGQSKLGQELVSVRGIEHINQVRLWELGTNHWSDIELLEVVQRAIVDEWQLHSCWWSHSLGRKADLRRDLDWLDRDGCHVEYLSGDVVERVFGRTTRAGSTVESVVVVFIKGWNWQ